MDTQQSKDVRKVRTFAIDAALAREQQSAEIIPRAPLRTPAPTIRPAVEVEIPQKPAAPIKKAEPAVSIPKKIAPIPTRPAALNVPPKHSDLPKKPALHTPVRKPALQRPMSAPAISIPSKGILDLEEESTKISVPKESVLADDTFESGEGTIIRDTKRKRFRLVPSMIEAVKEWFLEQKTAFETYRHPQNKITASEARKEVIERAIEKSALAPREDFEAIASRKKHEQQKPVLSAITIKKKTEEPAPRWSHIVEEKEVEEKEEASAVVANTASELKEEPKTFEPVQQPVNVQSQQPEDEIRALQWQTRKEAPEVAEPESVTEETQQKPQPAYEAELLSRPIPKPEPVDRSSAEPAQTRETPTPALEAQMEPAQQPASENMAFATRAARFAVIGFVLLSGALGVGISMYLFQPETPAQEVVVVYEAPSLVAAESQVDLPLGTDQNTFMQELSAYVAQNAQTVQIYPSVQNAEGTRPASTQEILGALSWRMPGSFARSIRQLTFGATASAPFLVLESTSFDVAFAGMLEWERTLSADLSPVFGAPVIESFDPSARTDTQVREAFFKDAVSSNKNIRLLLDEQGEDRIVYTFIDKDTILITTTREALSLLVPLVK